MSKPQRLWADDGNAFQCSECGVKTPRTMSDIMGERERHKKTCSAFKPGTRNFSVTLTFESQEEMEEFFKDKKKK